MVLQAGLLPQQFHLWRSPAASLATQLIDVLRDCLMLLRTPLAETCNFDDLHLIATITLLDVTP
jgi:hypothetical protein